jgi:hypothetical protein
LAQQQPNHKYKYTVSLYKPAINMLQNVFFSCSLALLCYTSFAQTTPPAVLFSKTYGGSKDDHPGRFFQTPDKGYVIGGWTFSNDGEVSGFHGTTTTDGYLVKTDSMGNLIWGRAIGGSDGDVINVVVPGPPNTYIIAGKTSSTDGDFATVTGPVSKGYVAWINAATGNIRRVIPYTGTVPANGVRDVVMIGDDRMIVYGEKYNTTSPKTLCVTMMDTAGNTIWEKQYGRGSTSTGENMGSLIAKKKNGGFMMAATTNSNSGDVTGLHGANNAWLVSLDDTGKILWAKCYGGSGSTSGYRITQTSDDGFICVGSTTSPNDSEALGTHGGSDYWVFKVNDTGKLLWSRAIGGSLDETISDAKGTCDDGVIITGHTKSTDGDITNNHGLHDIFTVRLDSVGNIKWAHSYGSVGVDFEGFITTTRDNGYAMLGFTAGTTDDLSGVSLHGFADIWLAKLAPDTMENYCGTDDPIPTESAAPIKYIGANSLAVSVWPNPANTDLNIQISGAESSVTVAIYDLMGRLRFSNNYAPHTGIITLPVTSLAQGLYTLFADSAGQRISQKINILR